MQKGWLTEAMKPMRPDAVREDEFALPVHCGPADGTGHERHDLALDSVSMISWAKRTFSRCHAQSASSGMYSMNRISTPVSRAKWPNGTISSSVSPRTETAFTFTG